MKPKNKRILRTALIASLLTALLVCTGRSRVDRAVDGGAVCLCANEAAEAYRE